MELNVYEQGHESPCFMRAASTLTAPFRKRCEWGFFDFPDHIYGHANSPRTDLHLKYHKLK
ncbi:MAG: hypothetical protein JWN74_1687 [Acidobacteriaceae bacterium]|jgi:hypothetical protein|nr:hypothetical protein [Acidobacteriaceae bacterium]